MRQSRRSERKEKGENDKQIKKSEKDGWLEGERIDKVGNKKKGRERKRKIMGTAIKGREREIIDNQTRRRKGKRKNKGKQGES